MKQPHLSDVELRVMRNAIYQPEDPAAEARQSDSSWETVKDNWRQDAGWLVEQYQKLKSP